jgi:polyisoprenoid-binding protein YceI
MKKQHLIILTAAAVISSAFTVLMNWKADEKTSTVSWKLPGHEGTFRNLNSSIDFDKAKLAESKITASIEVKTLKAGDEKLEAHLLSPDFFNAEKFPKITFTSTSITANGEAFTAKGNLTMKDSTKMVEIPFTFKEDGTEKATFSGTITLNAIDYGVMRKGKDSKEGADKVSIYLVVPVSK